MKITKLEVGHPPPQKGDLLLVQGSLTNTVVAYKVALTKVVDGEPRSSWIRGETFGSAILGTS